MIPKNNDAIESVNVLAPASEGLDTFFGSELLMPFAELTRDFLSHFSDVLLKDERCKTQPELVALGFWLRSSHVALLKQDAPGGFVKPLGTVVHFTPANVDTMFVYSWVCSVLMGNRNIVRVATQASELRDTLMTVLNELFSMPQFKAIATSNRFVGFDKHSNWTKYLSEKADARVLWGGDASVGAIRGFATPPRCRDISFADRHSAVVIDGNELTSDSMVEALAGLLWRDTQPYDQQACSSPRIVFWLGSTDRQHALFAELNRLAKAQRSTAIYQRNNHLVLQQLLASQSAQVEAIFEGDIVALSLPFLNEQALGWHTGGGAFLVKQLSQLSELPSQCDEKLQTLAFWGVQCDELLNVLSDPSITGIDRVVPAGQALAFSVKWDGFDLLSQLSRQITVG